MSTVAAEYAAWRELTEELTSVDEAPIKVGQMQRDLDDVSRRLEMDRAALVDLEAVTKKEYQAMQQLRSSKRKKLSKFLRGTNGGAGATREEQEEATYISAMHAEQECRERIAEAEQREAQLTVDVTALQPAAAKYLAVKTQLDALYARVFSRANPEYPEEEAAREALAVAEREVETSNTEAIKRETAYQFLLQAHGTLVRSLPIAKEAEDSGAFRVGRAATRELSVVLQTVSLQMLQAQTVDSGIPNVLEFRLPANIMQESFYRGEHVAEGITNVLKECEQVLRTRVGAEQKDRVLEARRNKAVAATEVANARIELERARYLAMSTQGAAPPMYGKDM